MNRIFKRLLIPNLLAASFVGVSLVPAQPASAGEKIGRDIAVGAGAGVVSGAIRGRGSFLNNAVKGAAAGAAVNAVNSGRRNPQKRNIAVDAGTGAAASTAAGAILRGNKDTLGDAVDGAAAGAVIHILDNND